MVSVLSSRTQGIAVVLSYQMCSLSTGELIESTTSFDEPVSVRAGVTKGIPEHLSLSLLGRDIGDELQFVFHPGMEDLPECLGGNDAYVIVLDLIESKLSDDKASRQFRVCGSE